VLQVFFLLRILTVVLVLVLTFYGLDSITCRVANQKLRLN